MAWAAMCIALGVLGCGGSVPTNGAAHLEGGSARELGRTLLRGMPRGADRCVYTAPHLVSDRRRALLAEISEADALGWARSPHVAAYVRCRYQGAREMVVWRLAIDGELDREALPMHVRWEEACEADACDWPLARWDGEVLELRSPALVDRERAGVEAELRTLLARQPQILEARLREDAVTFFSLDEAGVREVRRDETRHERVLAWEEVEVLAADRRLRREHALGAASERFLVADAVPWSDGDAVAAQLELRLERSRRRTSERRARVTAELSSFADEALLRRPEDGRVLELSLRLLSELGQIDDALARLDRARVEADFDEERRRWVMGLGWELAVRADHPSAALRLVEAGLAGDEDDARSLAPLLAEALSRDVVGPTSRSDVEAEILRMRALSGTAPLVTLERPVAMAPLGLLSALLALLADETAPVEIYASLDVASVPSATVAVLRDGTALTMLPGRGMHAAHELGSLELFDAASEALRSPGDGPFVVEIRIGPREAPSRVLRLSGTARRGRFSLEAVSSTASGWDWPRIARHLVTPFADAAELRFPSPELHWEGESDELLAQVESELELMRLAECELGRRSLTCTARAGRHREAILGAARALEVLPIE